MATGGSGGGQLELPRRRESYLSTVSDSLDEVPEEEKEETKKALYEYVFWRAEGDTQLSRDEAEYFREARLTSADGAEANNSSSNAEIAGRRLAELGDQIDAMYGDHFQDIMGLYDDNPDQAFQSFSAVVTNVFEWDEMGLPKINVGRVAAVLGYCYHLCRKYLNKYLNSYGLLGFLSVLATFLVKFFIKAKFYEWLKSVGGWGQLIQIPAGGILSRILSSPNIFLFIGVASFAVYVFQYFRGR